MNLATFTDIEPMRRWSRAQRTAGRTIGFVPTMGFLHEGHASLMRLAKQSCDRVVVSLFVNPAQFGPNEDFERYPRDAVRDLAVLRRAEVDALFMPAPETIYPGGAAAFRTWVSVASLSRTLCGAKERRGPEHFRGVATVVLKLFNIVEPDAAWFGQKDAQQALIVRTMARDLDLATRVEVAPTVREADGLAMSSRNAYLSPAERAAAPALHRALIAAETLARRGERRPAALVSAARAVLDAEPAFRLEYLELVDAATLEPAAGAAVPPRALLAVAGRIGATRLIDNLILDTND